MSNTVARKLSLGGSMVPHSEPRGIGGVGLGNRNLQELVTVSGKLGSKGSRILVFVRLRPMGKKEREAGSRCCVRIVNNRDIYLTEFANENEYFRLKRLRGRHFTFDASFHDTSTQHEVYSTSTSGCQFGEGCHFLHYVPGGFSALGQMGNMGPGGRKPAPPAYADGPAPAIKTKLCNQINTPEGCKFGDKCRFAHSEMELGRPGFSAYEDPRAMRAPMGGGYGPRVEPSPPGLAAAANFGASATAKISIDASLAGAVIGKGGVNSKQICRMTGVKFAIRDHDTDPNQKNVELEGNFDQIKDASGMVRELIMRIGASARGPPRTPMAMPGQAPPASNFKTKVCENFTKGSCTFGDRCHFAHGADELRKTAI